MIDSRRFVIVPAPSHRLNWSALRELPTMVTPECARCGDTGVIDGYPIGEGAEPSSLPCPVCNGGHVDPVTVRFVDVNDSGF